MSETYHLFPHDVEEGVEGEVVVCTGEARESTEYGSGDEDLVEMLVDALGVIVLFLHFYS